MNNLTSQRTARLAVLQILRLLFEDAAESVPMDPPEYLADMYCLWRAMTIATLPLATDDRDVEQEEVVRSQIAEIEERLVVMMRAYGFEGAMLDTERAELLPRAQGRRILQR
jgi:hypothetical protein